MKLFLLSFLELVDYDSYDSFVVAAENEEEARGFFGKSYMSEDVFISCGDECDMKYFERDNGSHNCVWQKENRASCKCIGTANDDVKKGLIISSFNAG